MFLVTEAYDTQIRQHSVRQVADISALPQMFPVLFCSPPCREVWPYMTALATEMPLLGGSFKSQGEIHSAPCLQVQMTRDVPINQHGSHGKNNIKQICDGCGVSKK